MKKYAIINSSGNISKWGVHDNITFERLVKEGKNIVELPFLRNNLDLKFRVIKIPNKVCQLVPKEIGL